MTREQWREFYHRLRCDRSGLWPKWFRFRGRRAQAEEGPTQSKAVLTTTAAPTASATTSQGLKPSSSVGQASGLKAGQSEGLAGQPPGTPPAAAPH